jgi:hypothetical protein
MQQLIIINGYAGAGKDTFVHMVKDRLNEDGVGVFNLSSITPVWELLRDHLGINMDQKTAKERKLAADVKAALDDYDFTATRMVMNKAYNELLYFKKAVAFIHMREPRAIKFCKENYTAFPLATLFIDRPQPRLTVGNVADDSVGAYTYDHYVDNDGSLEDLAIKAKAFVQKLF